MPVWATESDTISTLLYDRLTKNKSWEYKCPCPKRDDHFAKAEGIRYDSVHDNQHNPDIIIWEEKGTCH